jgi:hypothetical protein
MAALVERCPICAVSLQNDCFTDRTPGAAGGKHIADRKCHETNAPKSQINSK